MMVNKNNSVFLASLLSAACATSSAHAATLYLTELNATDVALTGAGWAARANDASTALSNPAGMTRLNGSEYEAMAMPIYIRNDFNADENTTVQGNTKNADAWLPSAGIHYVNKVNDNLAWGVSLAGYFGLGLDYDDDWVGRYYINESLLQTVGLQPSVGYKVNDQLSVGAGLIIGYTTLKQTFNLNNLEPNLGDGMLELEDSDITYQVNLGLLYEYSDKTRFGIQYLAETEADFEDIGEFRDLGPILNGLAERLGLIGTSVNFNMTFPQSVNLSFYHEMSDKFTLLGNATWQEWSKFGLINVSANTENDISVVLNKNFDNIYGLSLGGQFHLNDIYTINTGITYQSSMVEDEFRQPDLPMSDSIRLGIGFDKKLDDKSSFKASYELMWLGDMSMELNRGPLAGTVSGEYEDTAMSFFALSYARSF